MPLSFATALQSWEAFRTVKESYKSDKLLYNNPDDWVIIENTQEPIIEASVYWTVQNIRQGRRRLTRTGETDMFSGLLFCPDCGNKLYRTQKYNGKNSHFYSCSTKGKAELVKVEKRITELDNIIKRLYEDNISGKLTDERFIKLSGDYEHEQGELNSLVDTLRMDIKEREKGKADARNFVTATKKYTDLQELDASVFRGFFERIYVYEKDKQAKTQEVEIVYNFIGAFDFFQATEQTKIKKTTKKVGTA